MKKKISLFGLVILFPLMLSISAEEELSPLARYGHSAIYDTENEQMIVFGGHRREGVLADIWVYDINKRRWKEIELDKIPAPRESHSAIYEPVNKQMIMFGGIGRTKIFSDTWVYNIEKNSWQEIEVSNAPPARYGHTAIYNSTNKQMIVFGGHSAKGRRLSDTWIYDIEKKTWMEIKTKNVPSARDSHSAIYDSVNKQMIVFGGRLAKDFSETWSFDIESLQDNSDKSSLKKTWEEVKTEEPPAPRGDHTAVYDSVNKQMIIFGGGPGQVTATYCDTWLFDIGKKAWIEIETEDVPSQRKSHSAICDPVNKQMLIFGGFSRTNSNLLSDTWAFDMDKKIWSELKTELQDEK